jgi:hypothetical protein
MGRSNNHTGNGRRGKPQENTFQGSQKSRRPNDRDAGRSGRLLGPLFPDTRRNDKKNPFFERLKWKAPELSVEPIPQPNCPYCGKPIKDMAAAMADKSSGEPVHFECVAARIAEGETLESGDTVTYIGGGRFGIVHFPGMIRDVVQGRKNNDGYDTRNFQIKKIFEWEDKENRAPWRKDVGDHFSVV